MLTEAQIEKLEQRLLEEREQAARIVREMREDIENNVVSDGDLSRIPTHLADQGSDVQEEEKDMDIAERNSQRIVLIDQALRRLREKPEEFDVSVVSGMTIPFDRLEMVPWTRVLAGELEPGRAPGESRTRDVRQEREATSRRPQRGRPSA